MIDTGDIDVFLGLDVGKGEHHRTAVTPAGKKAFGKLHTMLVVVVVIDTIRVVRPGPERPGVRPDRVVTDKGYSVRSFRAYPRSRGIKATIPQRADQLAGRARRSERREGDTLNFSAAVTATTDQSVLSATL
ncbi:hypothetical protein [Streptomyces sp. NPDC059575]|uniref:hypothetical protein n=1 Tax=Streptomyces sp. NPDC059575 TaxID=3346872 RepID=UPI003683CE9B